MIFDDVVTTRRSIRHFLSKPVPNGDVCQVIKAALLSPSPKKRQPWKFIVLSEDEKKNVAKAMRLAVKGKKKGTVKESARVLESAPVAIAVKALAKGYTDTLSLGAAMQTMCLKATDLKLGSLWIGDTDVLKDRSEYADWAGVILLGYPDHRHPLDEDRKIKKFSQAVENLEETGPSLEEEDTLPDPDLTKSKFVFVSYSHAQSKCVKADVIELKRLGVPLWYDKGIMAGEKWKEKALGNIKNENSALFLWYITEESIASNAVYKEFCTALKRKEEGKINIIPIVIGENVPSLIHCYKKLRRKMMFFKYFRYKKYFGPNEDVVYLKRNMNPAVKAHLKEVLEKCTALKITENPSVYDIIQHVIIDEKAIITSFQTRAKKVDIPRTILGFPVTEIGDNVFRGNQFIESVTFPDTIKTLGSGAFLGTKIKKIEIPESVEEIKVACFRDCSLLDEVKLPPNITYLSEALFRGCTKLKIINAGETKITELKEAVFNGCSSLEEAYFPETLEKMTNGGFDGCAKLEVLSMPSSVKGANEDSFKNSPNLKRVELDGYVFERGKCIKKSAKDE